MFSYKKIVMVMASIGYCFCTDALADNTQLADETNLDEVVVFGQRKTQDEKGNDDVFSKNVANAYLSKEYLERYQINAAGDVLKGLNGVYSMNTRTAGGALTPNIRGISGKGRIPVTIDGTEQTVDVWMNNYGVGDRNYVDPALFRSIAVDKSADISQRRKTGIGGSVEIRTIEASDIIEPGQNFGMQLKTNFSNNAVKPQQNLGQYLGWEDYRTLPGGATADGAGGGVDPFSGAPSPYALIVDESVKPRENGSSSHFSDDKSAMLALAFQNDLTDGLVAYSYRKKGNYFAGKQGADFYKNNPVYDASYDCGLDSSCLSSSSFVPNMAKMYAPGGEVLNSNNENKTLLVKNNWHWGDNHKISLHYMRNDMSFGEINPYQSTFALNYSELNPFYGNKELIPQTQNIDTNIKTDTYKLGYEWKSDENPWIDLKANLWRVKTESVRHQSGGMSLGVYTPDPFYDAWYNCNVRSKLPQYLNYFDNCQYLGSLYGFDENTTQEQMVANSPLSSLAETGAFRVVSGATQKTKVTRDGLDISNVFEINDRVKLLVGADIQREELDEKTEVVNGKDMFNFYGLATGLAAMAGPRGGRREEWGINTSVNWQATDKLNIQAGVRYHRFWAYDDALAKERQKRNERYAYGAGAERYASGVVVPYLVLMENDEKLQHYKLLESKSQALNDAYNTGDYALIEQALNDQAAERARYEGKYGVSSSFNVKVLGEKVEGHDSGNDLLEGMPRAYYEVTYDHVAPFKNGKPDVSAANLLDPQKLKETVENPQGTKGRFLKYLAGYPAAAFNGSGTYDEKLNTVFYGPNSVAQNGFPGDSKIHYQWTDLTQLTEEEKWQAPQKIRGEAWSPMIALTYQLNDQHRFFARYAQMTRFPSLYETTGSSFDGLLDVPTTPNGDLKPEKSRSWELGYNFDFSNYFKSLESGDVRLTYYDNQIKNIIDTNEYNRITQYDKKINTGLELQARLDTGRYFASLGGTYRLQQKMCDKDMAVMHDWYLQRIPECVEGGYGATRFYQALQPKYSINLDLGTRLLDKKLELGMRGIYHSKVETSQYDQMINDGMWEIFTTTGKPYHWGSSFVVDAYGRYEINKNLSVNLGITNLTNRYYLDPMSNVPTPAPGRTVTLGLTGTF